MILSSRLTRQPQQALPIARSCALAVGLVAAYYPQGTNAVSQGSARLLAGPAGVGFASSTNSRWQVSANAKVSLSPAWTILTIMQGIETNNSNGGTSLYSERPNGNQIVKLGVGDGNTNTATLVVRDASGNNLVLFRGNADVRTMAAPRVIVAVRRSATMHAIYVNGRLDATSTANASGTFNDTVAHIGGDPQDVNSSLTGSASVPIVLLWNRALSDAEIAQVSANPWQVLAAPQHWMVAAVSSQAAGATLPAAQGSYTITGNAAALSVARKLVVSTGAYTIAGAPVALKVARYLGAVSGSYAFSGKPVNLIRGTAPRALETSTGAYVIAGRPAALRIARRLAVASGTYAITGIATGSPTSGSVPAYTAATIMRATVTNCTVDFGAVSINRTVGFP